MLIQFYVFAQDIKNLRGGGDDRQAGEMKIPQQNWKRGSFKRLVHLKELLARKQFK